jgi:hypothetical protein
MRSAGLAAILATGLLGAGVVPAESADACTCLPPDLVRSYNDSESVLRVRVVRERVRGDRVLYRARVVTTYKGCIRPGQRVRLVSSASPESCGLRLEVGRDFLVTADRVRRLRRNLAIDACGFNVPFERLSREQLRFLDTRFNCCGDLCSCVNSESVACFADPCQVAHCPEGECVANYCGGCHAEFYDDLGQAVCQPCARDDDCSFGQHCSREGICLSACESDADCGDGAWCSPTVDGGRECRPFQREGETCGGFTPTWAQLRCAPRLVCEPDPPLIVDAPGTCRRPCRDARDCARDQYCSPSILAPFVFGPIEPRVCRDDGACLTDRDCNDPANRYPHILCVGHGVCLDGLCGWQCGDVCFDLRSTDLGPCDAVLGWGLVHGACAEVSGCSASGLPIFVSREACERACQP